jgi:hypothetical protein
MSIHRKFLPQKDYPLYNNEVNRLIVGSSILSSNPDDIHSVHSTLWDRKNLEYALAEKTGDEDGFVTLNGKKQLAMIPTIKAQIELLEQAFAQFKKDRVKGGYRSPDIMPPHMLEEYYKLNAQLTVQLMEADAIEMKIANYKEVEDIESDNMVLKYGLQGSSKLRNGIIVLLDGMKCSETPEGIMIINDPRSPYHGMACSDYRDLCRVWHGQRKAANNERLEQLRKQAIEKGEVPPRQLPVSSMHKVNRQSLPDYPENIRNYLIEKPHRIRTA